MYCAVAILFFTLFLHESYQLKDTSTYKLSFDEVVNENNLKWIEQPLDHFDINEKRKFKMRYYEYKRFWKPNGPIYFTLGGESPDPALGNYSLYQQIAQEMNGLVVLAELRYYGESIPKLDLNNIENYKYLNSQQALADFAMLLESLKSADDTRSSKVIVAGCSYPGALAVWMRLVYPNLVDAAVASCAVLDLKVDAAVLNEKVGDDYKKYGSQACYDKIEEIFKRYERLFQTSQGIEQLKKEENICKDIDMEIKENKETFFNIRMRAFAKQAQFGTVEYIKQNCTELLKTGKFETVDPIYNDNEGCYDYSFAKYLNVTRNSDQTDRCWLYQICTEFGLFPSTISENQPFTKSVSVDFYIKQCMTLLGPEFNKERVAKGVENINKLYGGLHPNVTKVIFVKGEADLWSPLIISEAYSDDVQVIVIPDSFHCKHTSFISSDDSKELKDAKLRIIDIVKNWSK